MIKTYEIKQFSNPYQKQVIDLVLDIQNNEAKINLPLSEQPDLQNIEEYFINSGGMFWIAVENNSVIGTIGLKKASKEDAVLKNFFVKANYRGNKVGLNLYKTLLSFCKNNNIKHLILDTPIVATKSHEFYLKSGFKIITKNQLPFKYEFPDRNSILMLLNI